MKTLIKNGTLVNPRGKSGEWDVLLEDGVVKALLPRGSEAEAGEVVDARGLHVMPGFIDMHVHLREPGFEYKEDIASGTLAAAHGGFTAVACMPNTSPVNDNKVVIRYILDRAKEAGHARVYPIAAITKGLLGEEMTPMGGLLAAGAVAFSDDGRPVESAQRMRLALEYAKNFGALIISHCEDLSMAGEGAMNEGEVSAILGIKGISRAAEEVMLARELILAEALDCRVHIAHISTALGVDLLRQAKARGVKATGETCPHYFSATDEWCKGYDANAKMNPPLRTARDVEAIKQGLADGTLDCIVTDHAPHAAWEKESGFLTAPNGIIGLETAYSLGITNLVEPGVLTYGQLVEHMSCRPAEVLGVPGGVIEEGAAADITLADPKASVVYTQANNHSKSANSPFFGKRLKGRVVRTILGGKMTAQNL